MGAVTSILSSTEVVVVGVSVVVVSSSLTSSFVVVVVVVASEIASIVAFSFSCSCSCFGSSFVGSSFVDASGTVTGTADSSERSGMDVFSAAKVVVMGFVMNGSV